MISPGLIVIATFNGGRLLGELLQSMEQHGTNGYQVLVVDNHSSDPQYCEFLGRLQRHYSGPLQLQVRQPPYRSGYEPGAYMFAFREVPAERYLFLHDSMTVKSPEWVGQFERRLTDADTVVPWIVFTPLLVGLQQRHLDFLDAAFGLDDLPEYGFFGSIFSAHRSALLKLDQLGLLSDAARPRDKTGAEGMERGWAIACHRAGLKVFPVHTGLDMQRVHDDGYPHLRKIFVGRQ